MRSTLLGSNLLASLVALSLPLLSTACSGDDNTTPIAPDAGPDATSAGGDGGKGAEGGATDGGNPSGDAAMDATIDAPVDASKDSSAEAAVAPIGVVPSYVVSTWAQGTAAYFGPDSIDSDGAHVWVGFQNKTTKDGSDGGPGFGPTSTVVEYSLDGKTIMTSIPLAGHIDGLRVDPVAKDVWITSNEDGSPHLFKIDHATLAPTEYTLPSPMPHGGGLDDLGFVAGKMFIAASNPSANPNAAPALYVVTTSGTTASLTTAFAGNAAATDLVTGAALTLNLTDPDSITINPSGQLVLASQADSRLLFVTNPGVTSPDAGAAQTIQSLTLPTQPDDTVWITQTAGQLLVADGKANAIYAIRRAGGFTVNDVFTETPDDSTLPNILGRFDLATGNVSAIAVGFGKATGLLFLPD